MKILFICKGNVGRSQMAEFLFRQKFGDQHHISSAGVKLTGPEQPISDLLPLTKEVIDVMKEEGLDISSAVRNQLTPQMIEEMGKIIAVIEDEELLPSYLTGSPKLIRWNVPDPKGKDLDFTRDVREQIKQFINSFAII